MKKTLVTLLVLMLLCVSVSALAETNDTMTIEAGMEKLPVFEAGDPLLAGLLAETDGDALPVLLLPVKKSYELRATVLPRTVKNRQVTYSVENKEIAQVRTNTLTGLKAGETVLTIASKLDPETKAQYRVLVLKPVSRITLTPSSRVVTVGGQITVDAAISPEDAALKALTWKSDDPHIATVDENGVVNGVKRGETRIIATARDGSNIRANFSIRVQQGVEQITLNKPELTINAGSSALLKATVLPGNADNKNVTWSSTDEKVAKVNTEGRVRAVALGECEIVCTSKANGAVMAVAAVHVLQPVTKIAFGTVPRLYVGDMSRLQMHIEPATASNQALKFKSSAPKIVSVSEDGIITALKHGEAYITAESTDGSERRARVKVSVLEHVTGVKMIRRTAYICVGETATAGAELQPKTADNKNMSWTSRDTAIATVSGSKTKASIKGIAKGETTVIGTTEDGGYQTSILVRIGDWDHALKLTKAEVRGADAYMTVRNDSTLTITSITAEVSVFDADGNPVPANSKNDSNTFRMVYNRKLEPGKSTVEKHWKTVDFKLPDSPTVSTYVVKITKYQVDNDWIKVIRKKYQPTKNCPVHV